MKYLSKILFVLIALGAIACDPLDDYRDDLDESTEMQNDWLLFINERLHATEAEYNNDNPYVLADDDYASAADTNVAKYKSFSDAQPFEEHLPGTITNLYGNAGEFVLVQFAFYTGTETIDSTCTVTFTREYPSVNSYWDIVPNLELVEIDETECDEEYVFTDDDYNIVEGSGYYNFNLNNNTHEQVVSKINSIIKQHYVHSLEEGQTWKIEFATFGANDHGTSSPLYFEVMVN